MNFISMLLNDDKSAAASYWKWGNCKLVGDTEAEKMGCFGSRLSQTLVMVVHVSKINQLQTFVFPSQAVLNIDIRFKDVSAT